MDKDRKIILECIVGSQAYGLATPESDEDRLGVFVEPIESVLSFNKPSETVVKNKPDKTLHEVEKFIRLASKANPTVLELLFIEEPETMTYEGDILRRNRYSFLSKTIYHSYGGYAISQARKLNARGHSFSSETKNRHAKHARHCFRLLWQGRELLETGDLNVKLSPKKREELFAIGELPVDEMVNKFEEEFKEFDKIESYLPDKPDYPVLNSLLLEIRKRNSGAWL